MKRFTIIIVCLLLSVCLSFAGEKEPIKIAAIVAQSGVAMEAKFSSLRAVQLAVDNLNKSGGILGRPLKLLVFDNRSTPIGSKMAADKAVKAGVVGIIGSQWSSHSKAIAKVAQANRIPMISNISTHPDVTKVGDYIFRACYTDPFQGKVLARFARQDLKASTAVIMIDLLSDYSMSLARTFGDDFERLGGKVLLHLKYKRKQKDFKELLKQTKQASPDIIFLSGHTEGGTIIKQATELGIEAIYLGGDGWDDTVFFQNGGSHLKCGYFTTHWSKEMDIKASRDFFKLYPQYDVSAAFVLAYDATMLLADAIRRAGSTEPEKIREALAQTRDYPGITGMITMDQNGDPIKSAVIRKVEDGRESYLKAVRP